MISQDEGKISKITKIIIFMKLRTPNFIHFSENGFKFWPVMLCKVMHQICDRFYFIVKKCSRISQKTDFLANIERFFGYALWVMPQFLRQMKDLMKIYNRGKFHPYSICGSKVIKCQMFSWRCTIHEMTPFGWCLGPFSPKHG